MKKFHNPLQSRYILVGSLMFCLLIFAEISTSRMTQASPVTTSYPEHLSATTLSTIPNNFVAKLTADDANDDDRLGYSVAISGDTAVVGAPYDDDAGSLSGSAYIFVRNEGSWLEQAKLTASDAAASDLFGYSVAISNNTVVVGAHGNSDNGNISGSAYVFVRNGEIWSEQAKLIADDAASDDWFGISVGVSSDTAVVGAYRDDGLFSDSGSAYIFVRNGSTWTQQSKLTPIDANEYEWFGTAVAIDSNTVVIGKPGDDTNGANSGSAYIFTRSGTSWTEQTKLFANDASSSDNFGNAVSLSNQTIIIGAYGNDERGFEAGSAYVFTSSGTSWGQQAKLIATDTSAEDRFGWSVAVSGTTAIIGAYQDDDGGSKSGSAYVYTYYDTTWNEQDKLVAPDTAANDYFGSAVALSDSVAIIGAYFDDDGGNGSGSAYIYEAATAITSPILQIDNTALDATSGTITVPITFAGNGNLISSLGFSIDYDESCLTLQPLPGAVSGLPGGYVPSVSHDGADTDGELDISLFDQSEPLNALADGVLATLSFDVDGSCATTDGSTVDVAVEFSTAPAASFGNTDGDAVSGTATGGTLTLSFNAAPTNLTLFADVGLTTPFTSVVENNSTATVAYFQTTDVDLSDTHTYTLVAGDGDTDNALFAIADNRLEAPPFNFENKTTYFIRVQTDDGNGGTLALPLVIEVRDVNEAPVLGGGFALSLDENEPAGFPLLDLFATFSDPDFDDGHTYAITGTDAAAFLLNNGTIENAISFNYEVKSTYVFTARVTDSGGLFDQQPVTVTVQDVNDAPVAVADIFDPLEQIAVGPTLLDVLANDSDEDPGPGLFVASASSSNTAIDYHDFNTEILYTPAPGTNGSETFEYTISDGDLTSTPATVTVTYVADDPRGDCNGDGAVNAGDFSAIALELFDDDGGPNWWEIYNGAYAGSPIGCDSNASRNGSTPITNPVASVTSADIICTVLIFFGDATCANGTVQAAGSSTPALLRVADMHGEAGAQVQVPIVLTGGNQTIAAASFTIAYDSSQLTFDPTDGDGDGIPDALTFALPAGVQTWVRVEEGAIRIALAGLRLPLPHLADGTPVTVTFQVNATGSTVTLRDASFGDAQGNPLPAITQDGSVGSQAIQLFLPLITR